MGNLLKDNRRLMKEYDFGKNINIDLDNLTLGSERKVWWKCKYGHIYQMQVDLKAKRNYKCPLCSKGLHTSFPEKAIAYYLYKIDKSIIEGYSDKENNISELDIFIPLKKVGIEYDGARWHNESKLETDKKKNLMCYKNGIKLYRIREQGCKLIDNSTSVDIYYDPHNAKNLNIVIKELIYAIYKTDMDVDIKKDELDIYKKIEKYKDDISALNLSKEVLEEWDYEKNGILKPENFSLNSHISVWWKCKKCHGSWKAKISNRNNNSACPYCTGHKLLIGYNDLKTINPLLIKEWDYNKNSFLPSQVTAHSSKDAWWICPKGHSYRAKISNRNDLGRGCSICANKKIIKGINDLETLFPDVFKEWDYKLNNNINPYELAPGTAKKIHFICSKCGYKWVTLLSDRTKNGTGCPKCANSKKGEKSRIPICQYSLDGKLIKIYESSAEASKETGISRSAICQVLKGRAKTSGGYKWKYKK